MHVRRVCDVKKIAGRLHKLGPCCNSPRGSLTTNMNERYVANICVWRYVGGSMAPLGLSSSPMMHQYRIQQQQAQQMVLQSQPPQQPQQHPQLSIISPSQQQQQGRGTQQQMQAGPGFQLQLHHGGMRVIRPLQPRHMPLPRRP